jgi:hypothetical protein
MGPSEPATITAEVVKAVQCCRHMHRPFGVRWWEERRWGCGGGGVNLVENRTRVMRVPLGDSPRPCGACMYWGCGGAGPPPPSAEHCFAQHRACIRQDKTAHLLCPACGLTLPQVLASWHAAMGALWRARNPGGNNGPNGFGFAPSDDGPDGNGNWNSEQLSRPRQRRKRRRRRLPSSGTGHCNSHSIAATPPKRVGVQHPQPNRWLLSEIPTPEWQDIVMDRAVWNKVLRSTYTN